MVKLSRDGIKFVADLLTKSFPSDEIVLNDEIAITMRDIRREVCGNVIPLDDMFWGGMVPLPDVIIDAGAERFRFCVFDLAAGVWLGPDSEHKEAGPAIPAAVQHVQSGSFNVITIEAGEAPGLYREWHKRDGKSVDHISTHEQVNQLWGAWCTIQICLLHPQCKVLFSNPRMEKERTRYKTADGERRRYTWYVKKHIIGEVDAKNTKQEIKRHCQCWFVVGHWRQYKSGKKIFINGYWKGPMRHMKKNLDKGRERKIT